MIHFFHFFIIQHHFEKFLFIFYNFGCAQSHSKYFEMGAAESTPKIELRKDIPLSPNPFFNNVILLLKKVIMAFSILLIKQH